MKEAIGVLLQNEKVSERRVLSDDRKIARLHNICLPQILADEAFRNRHLHGKRARKTLEIFEFNNMDEARNEVAREVETREGNVVETIEEDEFRARYLPEERGAELAINFISTKEEDHGVHC